MLDQGWAVGRRGVILRIGVVLGNGVVFGNFLVGVEELVGQLSPSHPAGGDLGGGRDGDALLESLPVATDSAAAEGHADEAAACTYSRHAWLLSNPVGVPPDLSATEQGASTVAATLGRADGVPVDPPGLVPHKP